MTPQCLRSLVAGWLLASCLVLTACASMSGLGAYDEFVDGPSTIEVVGRYLYVDEDFGRVLRIVDLRTGRSRRVPLPAGGIVLDLEHDAGTAGRYRDKSWKFDAAQGLVEVEGPDEAVRKKALLARLPALPSVWIGDVVQTASGDVYFTALSEYAFGRRIWHLSPAGELTTVVGPWARVVDDPRQRQAPWYPKSLGSPVLDGRGNLWFLDYARRMILKVELSTGVVTFVHGGTIGPGPTGPRGQPRRGEYVDLAVDDDGNVYAADHGGQRVIRIDRDTGQVKTVARVGGKREQGVSDAVGEVAEPDHIVCDAEPGGGTAVVEVVDTAGAVLPGAVVYLLGAGSIESTRRVEEDGRALFAGLESRVVRIAIFLPGFQPAVSELRVSEGCTSTVRVVLQIGPMRSHRMF